MSLRLILTHAAVTRWSGQPRSAAMPGRLSSPPAMLSSTAVISGSSAIRSSTAARSRPPSITPSRRDEGMAGSGTSSMLAACRYFAPRRKLDTLLRMTPWRNASSSTSSGQGRTPSSALSTALVTTSSACAAAGRWSRPSPQPTTWRQCVANARSRTQASRNAGEWSCSRRSRRRDSSMAIALCLVGPPGDAREDAVPDHGGENKVRGEQSSARGGAGRRAAGNVRRAGPPEERAWGLDEGRREMFLEGVRSTEGGERSLSPRCVGRRAAGNVRGEGLVDEGRREMFAERGRWARGGEECLRSRAARWRAAGDICGAGPLMARGGGKGLPGRAAGRGAAGDVRGAGLVGDGRREMFAERGRWARGGGECLRSGAAARRRGAAGRRSCSFVE